MLATARAHFFLFVVAGFLLATALHAVAQSPQVPATAAPSTSRPTTTPVPATHSVPSAPAPGGYSNVLQPFLGNCCQNSFLPIRKPRHRNTTTPLAPGHRHHRDSDELLPIAVPVYIPYAIGYEPDEDDDATDDAEADGSEYSGSDYATDASNEPADAAPEQAEVTAQPATVLVFKDGHRADVINYAIVGDALFDFDEGRTHRILLADLDLAATRKANDALGVDFALPLANVASGPPQ